jgi:hypothetical protein
VREVARGDPGRLQAVGHRVVREVRVALLPGKALLLRGSHDVSIGQQAGGAVVIERGDAQHV